MKLTDKVKAALRVYTSRAEVSQRPGPHDIDWVIVNNLGGLTDRHPDIALGLYERTLRDAKDDETS